MHVCACLSGCVALRQKPCSLTKLPLHGRLVILQGHALVIKLEPLFAVWPHVGIVVAPAAAALVHLRDDTASAAHPQRKCAP